MRKINLAGCVILNGDKILLLHRKKADWYELPGGKIEDGKQPEIAAKREIKEELLCDVGIIKKIGEKDFEENSNAMGYTWFLAKLRNDQILKLGEPEKFDSFAYLPISNLGSYKLSFNMQNLLSELNSGNIMLE